MPLQLIFTSAPQGLTPGRSGYCTIARHRAIPDRLAQLLESVGTPHECPQGETFTFRLLEAGDKNWCVLSRFVARGLDYTQRDNRLAHHLIFSLEEAAILPPPAAIAGRWKGWRDEWTGAPTWLEGEDRSLQLESQTPLTPAVTWREETGTGAKAAWLINASGPAAVGLLNPPETLRLLRLLAEASALLGKSAWAATFTTDATTTGSDGFLWAVNSTAAAVTIDFATAKSLPAPSGDIARQAAAGLTTPKAAAGQTQRRAIAAPAASSNNTAAWIIGGVIILAAGAVALFLLNRQPDPTPSPVVIEVKSQPSPADITKTDEILKTNRALTEIQGLMDSDDFMGAAKLWTETSSLSPTFVRNYREQIIPRILSNFSASVTKQLLSRLDRPGVLNDPKSIQAAIAEAKEALRLGAEIKVPQDENWKRLQACLERAQSLTSIEVRPTMVIAGEWKTGESGPNSPSQADFPLSRSAADAVAKFIEASGATQRESVQIRIRLLAFTSPHLRDDRTKYLSGEIRRTPQATWIESTPEPGKLPAIGIGLSNRRNEVSLNFPNGEGARAGANRLIEVILPKGERQCFALIGDLKALQPLNLGPDALLLDSETGVIRPAPWAESAVNAFIWTSGSIGLYPEGHEFPDRDLPSIRATRSLLETDIIRMEGKQGPGTPPYEVVAGRRKLFKEGKLMEAGAPWTIQAIDANGAAGPRLLEFR
ncbi:MAG: hypothetical protein CK541_06930 [Opitutia bacterium]|nr:MAG: hypothetical protein CK541_06930 [Opitutae bacterium]